MYQKHLQLKEDDQLVFDFVLSMMAAVFCKYLSESVWAYLIAPPGACKTETVKALQGTGYTVFLSSLTENCLMSGYRDDDGTDPSLIQVLDHKLLVVKDISSLTNLPPRTINKIWGDLRDAYDQSASKASGTNGVTEYKARFGCLFLGTGALDVFAEEHQQLGERFLSFRMHRTPMTLSERQELAMHVSEMMKDKSGWQAEIMGVVKEALKDLYTGSADASNMPVASDHYTSKVMLMGNLLSLLRTTPMGGRAVSPELPTRVPQQLMNLGHAHAYCDGRTEWNDSDLDLVRRVTVDTLPATRARLVTYLFGRGKHRPYSQTTQIMHASGVNSMDTVREVMIQYEFSNLVEADPDGDAYRLSQEAYDALDSIQILKG